MVDKKISDYTEDAAPSLSADWMETESAAGNSRKVRPNAVFRNGIITESTTTRTLAASDENQIIRCTHASGLSLIHI